MNHHADQLLSEVLWFDLNKKTFMFQIRAVFEYYTPHFDLIPHYFTLWEFKILCKLLFTPYISAISWWSALLVQETDVPEENYWPVANHWQTLSHNVDNNIEKKKKTCIKIGWKIRKFKFWNSAFVGPFQWNISPKPYEIEEIRWQTTGSSVPEMDGRPVAKCD